MLTLYVHVCATRHNYTVKFSTEEQAVEFVKRKSSTCAFDHDLDLWEFPDLAEALYPTCEHGLSLSLCAGPNHYPTDL